MKRRHIQSFIGKCLAINKTVNFSHLPPHHGSTIVGRVDHTIVGVVDRKIRVPSPLGERVRFATSTGNRKSENEHHDLRTAIHRRRHKVVVLDEQRRVVLAEVKLADESNNEEHSHRAVDTDKKVAHVPENDRRVEIAPVLVAGEAVCEVSWNGHNEADQERQSDPLVARANTEHLAGNAPGDGESVELLNVLARPDVGTLHRLEDLALILYN